MLVALPLFSRVQISKTVEYRQKMFRHNDAEVKRW